MPSLEHIETVWDSLQPRIQFATCQKPELAVHSWLIAMDASWLSSGQTCEHKRYTRKTPATRVCCLSLKKVSDLIVCVKVHFMLRFNCTKKQFSLSCFWVHRQHGPQPRRLKKLGTHLFQPWFSSTCACQIGLCFKST